MENNTPTRRVARTSSSSNNSSNSNSSSRSNYSNNSRPRRASTDRQSIDDQFVSNPDFQEAIAVEGYIEFMQEYGILRQIIPALDPDVPHDVYVSQSQIKKLGLRKGDLLKGLARKPKEGERYLSLLKVETVQGMDPILAQKRPQFARLTPIFPEERIILETTPEVLSTRLIDLVSPVGKGQRGMIVAPPKAGKTWLLQEIAAGVAKNFPSAHLMVVLIGERPEEVTDMQRKVKGEVIASNFDQHAEDQTRVAELALERAKRRAEVGEDVVILLDSITRLARAYNLVVPPSGRTLSGGLDPVSLYPPKHFFGAARNFEEGGSLTILGTALVDTGSKMDDVIFEEFKGTGNMELHLDRALSERRVYPAIEIKRSGTRHEELLFTKSELEKIFTFRRMIDLLGQDEATQLVIDRLKKGKTNAEFLAALQNGG